MSDKKFRAIERKIANLVNKERIARRLSPLVEELRLSVFNRGHAQYCADLGSLNHDFAQQRVTQFSDDIIIPEYGQGAYFPGSYDVTTIVGFGENVAGYYLSESQEASFLAQDDAIGTISESFLSRELVVGWLNSPNHFANIIETSWSFSGIGTAYSPETKLFVAVQIFIIN